jgi:enamine deaminase RidA (YjgF/YER057c/UK114 family)
MSKPAANYLPYRLAGNLLYLSGQGPRDANGASLTGKLGAEIVMLPNQISVEIEGIVAVKTG